MISGPEGDFRGGGHRFIRLEHVGIAVHDAGAAARRYAELGFRVEGPETLESERVRTYFAYGGGGCLELLEPLDGKSVISRFLGRRGEGVHHVAFRVDDLEASVRELGTVGGVRRGTRGRRVAFIHPKDAHGVLIELVEGGEGDP